MTEREILQTDTSISLIRFTTCCILVANKSTISTNI